MSVFKWWSPTEQYWEQFHKIPPLFYNYTDDWVSPPDSKLIKEATILNIDELNYICITKMGKKSICKIIDQNTSQLQSNKIHFEFFFNKLKRWKHI